MSQKKIFELATIISLVNNTLVLHVMEEDKKELVEHVVGAQLDDDQYEQNKDQAVQYLLGKYPKIAEAAKLCQYLNPDYARYQKLIDLCRKNHEIETMQQPVAETKVKSRTKAQAEEVEMV